MRSAKHRHQPPQTAVLGQVKLQEIKVRCKLRQTTYDKLTVPLLF